VSPAKTDSTLNKNLDQNSEESKAGCAQGARRLMSYIKQS